MTIASSFSMLCNLVALDLPARPHWWPMAFCIATVLRATNPAA
jgi:hypothetical protein